MNRPSGTIEGVAEGIPKRGFSRLVQALNSTYMSQCLLHFTSLQWPVSCRSAVWSTRVLPQWSLEASILLSSVITDKPSHTFVPCGISFLSQSTFFLAIILQLPFPKTWLLSTTVLYCYYYSYHFSSDFRVPYNPSARAPRKSPLYFQGGMFTGSLTSNGCPIFRCVSSWGSVFSEPLSSSWYTYHNIYTHIRMYQE
jgi:hypothetical protein